MLKSSFEKIISQMTMKELKESIDFCTSCKNGARRFPAKMAEINAPIISAATKEIRRRNEQVVQKNKELICEA